MSVPSLEPPQPVELISRFQPPLQQADGPLQIWPQGWRGMVPPFGVEAPTAQVRMRTPSPQPHIGHVPMHGMPGRSVEVPVVVADGSWPGRRPDETKAIFPHGVAHGQGFSPGPAQVRFQQPYSHSARSASPRSHTGGPPSIQTTPRQTTPPLVPVTTIPPQKQIVMPAGLFARIDGIVSEVERELREADKDPPLAQDSDRPSIKPEGQPTVDWLNKQIQMLQEQRKAEIHTGCSNQDPAVAKDAVRDYDHSGLPNDRLTVLEKEHLALKQRLEEELRAVRASKPAADRPNDDALRRASAGPSGQLSHHSLPGTEELRSARGVAPGRPSHHSVSPNHDVRSARSSLVAPASGGHSQNSLFAGEEIRSARGSFVAPDRTSQHSVLPIEDLRSLRASVLASERHSRASGLPNDLVSVHSSQILSAQPSQQLLEARLCETQAALEREQRVSEEAVEAHQAAEASLRALEDKSQNVLQDCRSLQAKVLQLETEHAPLKEAHEVALRRIAQMEDETLAISNQSVERLQILDLENKLSTEASRVTEAEMELADVKVERDTYLHQSKTASARIFELEGQLGQALAVQERKDGELQVHLNRIQDLEDLLAKHQGVVAEYQRQILELERKVAELESNESRRVLELEKCRSELKIFEEEHRNIQDTHARAVATHRSKLAASEQQLADVEATGHASVVQYQQRVRELEKELYAFQASKENHSNTNYAHKAAITDLKQQIEHLHTDKERHVKHDNQQRARILELEQQVEALQAEESAEKRQHAAAKQRILEMTQQLEDSEFAKESLSRQIQSHKQRITTLEEDLEQLQSADTDHHRQHQHHKTKISDLEEQVQTMMSSEENHHRQHKTNKERMEELEQQLVSAKDEHRNYAEQITTHKMQAAEMEEHLSHARALASSHAEEASVHRERAMDLDVELTALKAQFEEVRASDFQKAESIRTLEAYVEVARNAEAASADLAQQVSRLESDLSKERTTNARLENELHDEKSQLEKARLGLELAKRSLEEGDTYKKTERVRSELDRQDKERLERDVENYKLKIDELTLQLELERKKTSEIRSQAITSLMIPSSASSQMPISSIPEGESENAENKPSMNSGFLTLSREEVRRNHRQDSSLAGASEQEQDIYDKKRSLAPSKMRALKRSGTFMPGSTNPVVVKLRHVDTVLRECLDECYEMHAQTVEDQLANMLEAYMQGKEFRDGLTKVNPTLQAERQAASIRMQSFQQELMDLRDELQDNMRLSEDLIVQKEIGERLRLDLDKCDEELKLLQPASPLLGIPEGTLQTLMEVYEHQQEGQPLSMDLYSDGFSPMHWAAQNGRRDIINYLLMVDGGEFLLNARDKSGHPPLYYAHGERRPALAQFLMDSGANEPMHTHETRPDVSMLPSTYQKVLQHIETHGWHSMNWKDGFTMLHWAAEKGLGDLCRYLITMDADPSTRDNKYRKPADCAREANQTDVAKLLQDIEDKPQTTFDLQAFGRSGSRPAFHPQESRTRFSTGGSLSDDNKSDGSVGSNEGIPAAYVQVLEQIDRVGWDKMVWARGYTLLHWAGKNDRADLCAYFMFSKADPNHRDDNGKSAIDYAKEANSSKALSQLLSGAPSSFNPLAHWLISKKPRDSTIVEAAARPSVQHLVGPPASTFPQSFVPQSFIGMPQSFIGGAASDDSN